MVGVDFVIRLNASLKKLNIEIQLQQICIQFCQLYTNVQQMWLNKKKIMMKTTYIINFVYIVLEI